MAKRRKRRRSTRRKPGSAFSTLTRRALVLALVVVLGATLFYGVILDRRIVAAFEGSRWLIPARVYARPLELYAGQRLSADGLVRALDRLGYRAVQEPTLPGRYRRSGAQVTLVSRAFEFWDGAQDAFSATIRFSGGRIRRIGDGQGNDIPIARLDPLQIGSIVPTSGEDRVVLDPDEVPSLLPAALIAIEDQRFERHFGIDLRAIARAALSNVRAGGVEQGGSTITQQLVKSYFLHNRRTFRRKATEALMAVIVDARYDKNDILNAYINEIYLGQDGARAIHGFGLGSHLYFGRPLGELDTHQIALLVALVRGPTAYDPRRHPDAARERRDWVLDKLAARGVLDAEVVAGLKTRSLDILARPARATTAYPGFLALVKRQLASEYRPVDLRSKGLAIFTTLDPSIQAAAEQAFARTLDMLPAAKHVDGKPLEAAAVVTAPASGEIVALLDGRAAGYAGFNRALDTRRPIGSLIKPFVYLAAFERGGYHLASVVHDAPLVVALENGAPWEPQNFSREFSGDMPLIRAFGDSINLPAVHVGMKIGVERVVSLLERLGLTRRIEPYPAILLGGVEMAPIEVAQLYNGLAAGGFSTPLRAVREVVTAEGMPLRRFGLAVRRAADPVATFQINEALKQVINRGTARAARTRLPAGLTVAGKTGSTNDLRDSWFAGFSGDRAAVVWLGYDDNSPIGLTGARGALDVWVAIIAATADSGFEQALPGELEYVAVDYHSGGVADAACADAVLLPLPAAVSLPPAPGCEGLVDSRAGGTRGSLGSRFKVWLERTTGDTP